MSNDTIINKIEENIKTDVPKLESFLLNAKLWIEANKIKSALILGFIFGFILGTLF
jgi:hypothetical protein